MTAVWGPGEVNELIGKLRKALGDRYTVAAELGRGGMAVVYRARDLRHDRDVAVKVLRPELRVTMAVDRFLQEIRIAAQLQHPHIIPLHDSGQADGLLFYVMPLVEGETLRQRLAREPQLPISKAIGIAREVASALAYAHGQDVVHRDIKPENILLSSGQAMVADFGIARAIEVAGGEGVTGSGIAVGTPAYMSPEQAGAEARVDGRTDVYALGCVLYEMLVGEPPFTGPTPQAVLARHMAASLPSVHVVRPNVPPEVEAIVHKALAKSPADRFATAAEFERELALVASAATLGRAHATRRMTRGLVGSAVAAAGALALWLVLRADEPAPDPNKVVVFPLVERGLASADSGAGNDVALMLGAALEHTEPLKWIDGWQLLDERRRDRALLTLGAAQAISRNRRARYFVEGVVRGGADSMVVVLRLHDAMGDSLIAQETATAAAGSAPAYQLGLAAVRRLLPKLLDPERVIDLAPLSDRRPAAIALWIQGERQYRRGRFAPALEFYERAVREDSSLVFAAVKGAQAASWIHSLSQARTLIALAVDQQTLLPRRYRHFAHGLKAYLTGNADTAVVWLERALMEEPQWEEASTALGQVFHQLFPSRALLDSLAEAAFASALVADSTFTPPMFHLIDIAVRRGETGRAGALMGRLRRAKPDSTLEHRSAIMVECIERGARKVNWDRAARGNMRALLSAAKGLSAAGAQPQCAEAGFKAILAIVDSAGYRWAALVGLHGLLAAQGRMAELTGLLDSAITAGTSQALWLYLLDVEAGLPVRSQAAQMEVFARQRYGDAYQGAAPHTQWLLGIWHARLGNVPAVDALHRAMSARVAEPAARVSLLGAQALAAHLALARGDTTGAIVKLHALQPTAVWT